MHNILNFWILSKCILERTANIAATDQHIEDVVVRTLNE